MPTKQDLLACLTEAARIGRLDAITATLCELKRLNVPTVEVSAAFRLGQTKSNLGL